MAIEQKLMEFLDRIDEYIKGKGLEPPELIEDFKESENLTYDEIKTINQDDCFNYAFLLCGYADHVNAERSRQENVVLFCKHSIDRIVAREFLDLKDVYSGYDMKVAIIIRENDVAQKLTDFKNVAECRIRSLKNKEYNIRKKIDCLLEKGKRR